MNTWAGLLQGPWAISEEGMRALTESLRAGGGVAEAGDGAQGGRERAPRRDTGGVAVIQVFGPLVKRPVAWPVGLAESYQAVRQSLDEALADPAVRAVLLDIDSPGGTVDGCRELTEHVRSVRGVKPLYALADGCATSAAFWLAAATGRIFASSPTALVGSVGVLQLHQDWSGWNQTMGIRPTWLHAGRFKALGNPDEPLDETATQYFQERLDQAYRVFVQDVAGCLGLDPGGAGSWADGQYFRAERGLELGLVHGIATREQLIGRIQEDVMTKTAAQLRAEHPEAVQEIVGATERAAQAKADKERDEAVARGRDEARGAVLALAGAALGPEAAGRLTTLLQAGVTPEQLAALGYQPGTGLPGADGPGRDEAKDKDSATEPAARVLAELQRLDPAGVRPGGAVTPPTDEQKRLAAVDRMAGMEV
ncbi:MAG: S49 family peptidase [Desulfovibrionaceae bacterium]